MPFLVSVNGNAIAIPSDVMVLHFGPLPGAHIQLADIVDLEAYLSSDAGKLTLSIIGGPQVSVHGRVVDGQAELEREGELLIKSYTIHYHWSDASSSPASGNAIHSSHFNASGWFPADTIPAAAATGASDVHAMPQASPAWHSSEAAEQAVARYVRGKGRSIVYFHDNNLGIGLENGDGELLIPDEDEEEEEEEEKKEEDSVKAAKRQRRNKQLDRIARVYAESAATQPGASTSTKRECPWTADLKYPAAPTPAAASSATAYPAAAASPSTAAAPEGARKPLKKSEAEHLAVARISLNSRFPRSPFGAEKYSPVKCSRILKSDECHAIRARRGHGVIEFQLQELLPAGCAPALFRRKILAVPSVGFPDAFKAQVLLEKLLWAARARERPTYLVVHASEADGYGEVHRTALAACGVGLICWTSKPAVYGFGISRLAAQAVGELYGERDMVVLCDHNVLDDKTVANAYETDKEDDTDIKSDFRYTAAGHGSGVPRKKFGAHGGELIATGATKGLPGRPIEQVVTVKSNLFYDPCFITSSEDVDMSNRFLAEEFVKRRVKRKNQNFKAAPEILKVAISGSAASPYMALRKHYLESLSAEDDIVVEVVRRNKLSYWVLRDYVYNLCLHNKDVKKASVAERHPVDPLLVRSLIIEKILVRLKMAPGADDGDGDNEDAGADGDEAQEETAEEAGSAAPGPNGPSEDEMKDGGDD